MKIGELWIQRIPNDGTKTKLTAKIVDIKFQKYVESMDQKTEVNDYVVYFKLIDGPNYNIRRLRNYVPCMSRRVFLKFYENKKLPN